VDWATLDPASCRVAELPGPLGRRAADPLGPGPLGLGPLGLGPLGLGPLGLGPLGLGPLGLGLGPGGRVDLGPGGRVDLGPGGRVDLGPGGRVDLGPPWPAGAPRGPQALRLARRRSPWPAGAPAGPQALPVARRRSGWPAGAPRGPQALRLARRHGPCPKWGQGPCRWPVNYPVVCQTSNVCRLIRLPTTPGTMGNPPENRYTHPHGPYRH
jgi:hypothetical protein